MSDFSVSKNAASDIRARYSTVEKASHPDALKLLAFWDARPADGLVMGRDVPCRAIASLLSHLAVLEPTADRTDFSIRMAGGALIKRWGEDVKGRMLSTLFTPDEFRDHLKSCLAALDSDRPVIVDSALIACGTVPKMQFEVVLFPLFAADHAGKLVASAMFYFSGALNGSTQHIH